MKDLLPIGSVVRLKEATKSLMIIGTMQVDAEGKRYDYISCIFPEGYIDSDTFFTFQHEDIETVDQNQEAVLPIMRYEHHCQNQQNISAHG